VYKFRSNRFTFEEMLLNKLQILAREQFLMHATATPATKCLHIQTAQHRQTTCVQMAGIKRTVDGKLHIDVVAV